MILYVVRVVNLVTKLFKILFINAIYYTKKIANCVNYYWRAESQSAWWTLNSSIKWDCKFNFTSFADWSIIRHLTEICMQWKINVLRNQIRNDLFPARGKGELKITRTAKNQIEAKDVLILLLESVRSGGNDTTSLWAALGSRYSFYRNLASF